MGKLDQFVHDEPTRTLHAVNDRAGERAREMLGRKDPEEWENLGISAQRVRDIMKRHLTPNMGECFTIAKHYGLTLMVYVGKNK